MPQVTSSHSRRALGFAHWLRQSMAKRQLSQRALGKLIDEKNPEVGRRTVIRHLSGRIYPTPRMREAYATVFGEEWVEESDDEEVDLLSMVEDLLRRITFLRREMKSKAAA